MNGFPFFAPAYIPGYEITIYGEKGFGKDLKSIFSGQLDRDYFPVELRDMRADLNFEYLGQEPVAIGDARVSREYVNHPGATVGYKLECDDTTLVYVPDNEFLRGYMGSPGDLDSEHPAVVPDQKLLEFITGADLLIHEAQYTNEEYPSKIGWGHTCLSNACALVQLTGVPMDGRPPRPRSRR